MSRVNLIWLDDDLLPRSSGATSERGRLQTWLRYFNTGDRLERINLIEVHDLPGLRRVLHARADKPTGDPDHIDAFLIDVLWRESSLPHWTFSELDPAFADERVLPLDAGAQLIGLMRNTRYGSRRPRWLGAFSQHPMAVLTTLSDHRGTIDHHVDDEVAHGLTILIKEPGRDEPDKKFCDWVSQLRRR